eukprot:scaffold23596_cov20-Tisochrysis_lutea.AAC.1
MVVHPCMHGRPVKSLRGLNGCAPLASMDALPASLKDASACAPLAGMDALSTKPKDLRTCAPLAGMDALSASLKGLTSTEHAADANLLPDKQATSLGGLELSAGLSSLPGLAEALGAAAAAAAAGSAGGPQELPALSTMGSQQQQQQQQAQEQGGDSITAGGAIKQDNAAALPSPSRGPGRGVVGGGVGDASINAEAIS